MQAFWVELERKKKVGRVGVNKGIGGGRKGEERNIGDADNIFPDLVWLKQKQGKI